MNDPDNIFDTGLCAIVGALGISAGILLGGDLAFWMYCAMVAVGIGAMTAALLVRDLQCRYAARQWRVIQRNLPVVEMAVVTATLVELIEVGRT
jgi:hypothetical protein